MCSTLEWEDLSLVLWDLFGLWCWGWALEEWGDSSTMAVSFPQVFCLILIWGYIDHLLLVLLIYSIVEDLWYRPCSCVVGWDQNVMWFDWARNKLVGCDRFPVFLIYFIIITFWPLFEDCWNDAINPFFTLFDFNPSTSWCTLADFLLEVKLSL